MWISETLLEEVKAEPKLHKILEIVDEPQEMQFDVLGNLAR
jgi:hypothetical protein